MIKTKNLHGSLRKWIMSQKFPVDGFKWVENTPQFNEEFIKSYNEDKDKGLFPELNVLYTQKLH